MMNAWFCPSCENILVPRSNSLYCKSCNEFYTLHEEDKGDFILSLKVPHEEKELEALVARNESEDSNKEYNKYEIEIFNEMRGEDKNNAY